MHITHRASVYIWFNCELCYNSFAAANKITLLNLYVTNQCYEWLSTKYLWTYMSVWKAWFYAHVQCTWYIGAHLHLLFTSLPRQLHKFYYVKKVSDLFEVNISLGVQSKNFVGIQLEWRVTLGNVTLVRLKSLRVTAIWIGDRYMR